MTGTLVEKMESIRTLVTEKKFPDTILSLPHKLLWAHSELGEAIDEFHKDNRTGMYEELVDVAFYILDFLGIVQRDIAPLQSDWNITFEELSLEGCLFFATEQYGLLIIQRHLSYATNLYKKGEDIDKVEYALFETLCCIKQNVICADDIFDMKMTKNMSREVGYGQKVGMIDNIEESLEKLQELNPKAVVYRDLDHAYVGFVEQYTGKSLACYSFTKIIKNLMGQGMEYIDALDYYGYNIAGNWAGEHTPVLLQDDY